jgi:hypothetical protein
VDGYHCSLKVATRIRIPCGALSKLTSDQDRDSEPATAATAIGCGTFTGSCEADGPKYTRIYRGKGELIDHVFASRRLVNPDSIPAVEIVAASPLPSMTDDPTPQTIAPSDHAAVVATFRL